MPYDNALLLPRARYRLRVASPPAVTPTLGSEILLNGNMETGSPPSNWSLVSGGSFARDADAHGGSWALKLTAPAGGNNYVWQKPTIVAGSWYAIGGWAKATSGDSCAILGLTSDDSAYLWQPASVTDTSYAQRTGSFRNPAGNTAIDLWLATSAATDIVWFDDLTLKAITFATMLGLLGDPGIKVGVFDLPVTVPATFQGGLACCLTDETNPTYMLYCYTDRTNAVLVKRENDVETKLIDTATGVTYAAARRLRIFIEQGEGANSTVGLYYESAVGVFTQISTDQTIDLSSYGTKMATFSSDVSVTFGQAQAKAVAYA